MEFQVIDISSSFNLFLVHAWLHEVRALPSSLHKKLKILFDRDVIVIEGDPKKATVLKDSPILGIGS